MCRLPIRNISYHNRKNIDGWTGAKRRILSRGMALITNVSDYEELAKQKLSKMVYDFYALGAEDQRTLKENREAFSRIL